MYIHGGSHIEYTCQPHSHSHSHCQSKQKHHVKKVDDIQTGKTATILIRSLDNECGKICDGCGAIFFFIKFNSIFGFLYASINLSYTIFFFFFYFLLSANCLIAW